VSPPGCGRSGLRLAAALVTVTVGRENFGNSLRLALAAEALRSAGRPLASDVTVLTVTSARLFKLPLAVTQTCHAGGLCQ